MMKIEEYSNRLSQQGLSIEQYFQMTHTMTHTTIEDLKKQLEPVAKRRAKGQLVLFAIAKKEDLIVTDREFEQEIKRLSVRYLMPENQVKTLMKGKEERRLKQEFLIQKAYQLILEKNQDLLQV